MIANMKKTIMAIMVIMLIVSGCGTSPTSDVDGQLQVAVSVVPQATFVEKVAGDLVEVVTIIPPGSSPANYEPTPQQMIQLNNSALYFAIGVPAEEANILPNMVENTEVKVVELQSVVADVYEDRVFGADEAHEHENEDHEEGDHDEHEDEDHEDGDHDEHEDEDHEDEDHVDGDHDEHEDHDHEEGSRDPHIWLSPKRVVVMVEAIRDELVAIDPENATTYEENAAAFIEELTGVDQEIKDLFAGEDHLGFIITHPSVGYFADDYGLAMTSLEKDGKQATAAWMQEIIDLAHEEDIHVVFYQAEFDSTQAGTLAEAIGGEAVEIEPLSPNYIDNLRSMAEAFLQD